MLKKGKEEIIYLLTKCIEKYQRETSQEIILNTNRKNYEALAIMLSEVSNKLPETAESLGHQPYEIDFAPVKKEFPFRKYDITGGQIKDALMGLVSNPRPYLVDTCYIYLFGVGRQAFESNPQDDFLTQDNAPNPDEKNTLSLYHENQKLKMQLALLQQSKEEIHPENVINPQAKRTRGMWLFGILFLAAIFAGFFFIYQQKEDEWNTIKRDINLMPYKVTAEERKMLEGIWICYTGSPQARISDSSRYHKVVANLIEIEYKNGYFTYNRFGASFNHIGYVQFESKGLLSIHSHIKNNDGQIESPRHSLMLLDSVGTYQSAISASWNFDVGDRNRIIGIREAYQKLGNEGKLVEIINSVENASCQCKIIHWQKPDNSVMKFYLKNISLDELKDSSLLQLIDEHSILPKNPRERLVLDGE